MSNSEPAPIARLFAAAVVAARSGDKYNAALLLDQVEQVRLHAGERHGVAELQLLQALRARYALATAETQQLTPRSQNVLHREASSTPGVSVVSCCMNRSENLVQALPTWLAHKRIDEILIVDWSSSVEVAQRLREAGICDERIRIIRVVDEPRWILSYAFNLGFRHAKRDLILKLDADITLKPNFFERNIIKERIFIAGNWEAAEKGQEHINGFFFVHRSDLLRIKGFNEYITTYGWDDDDIYARLQESGIQRVCVDTKSIYHIPHDDAQRLGGATSGQENAFAQLHGDTLFKIRSNRYIATVTPRWNGDRVFAPFELLREESGYMEVRRQTNSMPHLVSEDIRKDSEYYATVELLSWRVGPSAYHLSRQSLYRLLKLKRLEEISQFDVDVCLCGSGAEEKLRRHSLYVVISATSGHDLVGEVAELISTELRETDVAIFVRGASSKLVDDFVARLAMPAARLARWVRETGLTKLAKLDATGLRAQVCQGPGALLTVSDDMLQSLPRPHLTDTHPTAPNVYIKRSRLYIDVQHGLGNRLRAWGSAAAAARATGRELVVLWAADHHCDCRLRDLFDYDGAFVEHADELPTNLRRYNYMEIEPNAVKGEAIDLNDQADVLVRSAYVLTHPASQWEAENVEIRRLKPTAEVMDLVRGVSLPNGCVGAHVRMEAGKGLDHNSYDAAKNWSAESHEQIHYWRSQSHYSAFLRRLDELISKQPETQIFLATDLPENYEVFQQCYGERLRYLRRNLYDRSREQLVYALADALLLSRCSKLLGSTWSSFSELAMRLSSSFSSAEMSGKDF
jgi:glycosyltransferase involved in cell wall biosynthesis